MGGIRSTAVLCVALGALTLASCGGDDDETAATTTAAGAAGCETAERPGANQVDLPRPERVLERGEKATATVETTCGRFVIELDTEIAPKTANSFAYMAEQGVYDGTWFHRIVTDAFIQGGDPQGSGTGDAGYKITEPPPPDVAYLQGFVAMSKNQVDPPGTSGSQFFVVAQADAGLPPDFALFGQVVNGVDVVKRIAALGDPASGQAGTPTQAVLIKSVKVQTG
jgi:peptidyl-prolyl cis-trans isomerase B (cyclophilin B)